MPRKPVIAGNWKMYKTSEQAVAFVEALPTNLLHERQVDVVLCVPFTALDRLCQSLSATSIGLGAQNLHEEKEGAFTGEISADMLRAIGCQYVIIGHSERRQYFMENDIRVNLKLKAALDAGLKPIVCVGETLAEREAGQTDEVVRTQTERAFAGVSISRPEAILIAYEPVWAIGTGKTCASEEANRVIGLIRRAIASRYGEDTASQIRILYGGSVKPETISEQMRQPEIDGALVGGASLKPDSFTALVTGARG